MKLAWEGQAKEDLSAIGEYIAKDDPGAARRHVERLRRRARQAARFPNSGRIVPERNDPSIRELIEGNYRIICRIAEDAVRVLAVREAHRPLAPEPGKDDR